jgi:hypothetical protein
MILDEKQGQEEETMEKTAEEPAHQHDIKTCFDEHGLHKRQHRHRVVLVVLTAINTTFLTGAFFGWGPMQLMLEENGAFASLCQGGQETPCSDQTARLLNVQLVAQLTMVFSPLAGYIGDKYGLFTLICIAAGCCISGLLCLTISTAKPVDILLYFTFILIGLSTVTSHINMIGSGMLFEGVTQQRVISLLNTLFDTGALLYLGLWAIQNATNVAVEIIFAAYLVFAVVVYVPLVYLWKVVVPVRDGVGREQTFNDSEIIPDAKEMGEREYWTEPPDTNDEDEPKSFQTRPLESSDPEINIENALSSPASATDDPVTDDYVLIANRRSSQQLRSKQFLLLVLFYSYHGASNVFTLTTARDFLGYLGDDEYGNRYLTIFTLLTPASVLALPFMDLTLNKFGYHAGLQAINVLAIIHGVIKVSSDNLNVQILGFAVFSFFRCFLVSVSMWMLGLMWGETVSCLTLCRPLGLLVHHQL